MSIFGEQKCLTLRTQSMRASIGYLYQSQSCQSPLKVSLGRNGQTARKKEGDGKTPIGCFTANKILYRQDRIKRPQSRLPISPIKEQDGWCDAAGDRNYNRPVTLPYPQSAESLYREDEIYNLILILNHNQRPRIQGTGSAIFIHIAKTGWTPTEGCIALQQKQLIELVKHISPSTTFIFGA